MFGSFPSSPLVVCASKVYSGLGADIVYGIITLRIPAAVRPHPPSHLCIRYYLIATAASGCSFAPMMSSQSIAAISAMKIGCK
jgi:hypothetical protein